MDPEDYGTGNEHVDDLLRRMAADESAYASVDEISGACQYLSAFGRMEEADRLMQWGLTLHVGDTTLLMVYATMLLDNHNVEKAESLLAYIGDSATTHFYYHLTMGKLHSNKEDFPEAKAEFEAAVALAPDSLRPKAILDAATTLGRFQSYDYALKFYEMAPREVLWGDSSYIFDYGYTLSRVGREQEAVTAFQRSAELDPFNEHSWFNLGVEYAKLGDNDKAFEAFSTAADVNPANPSPFFNMGLIYMTTGRHEEAIVSLTEYISLLDKVVDFSVYEFLAECWKAIGNIDLANRFLALIMAKNTSESSAWFEFAQNHLQSGDNSVAMGALTIAIGINPNVPEYYYSYAQTKLNDGDIAACISALEKGVSLRPGDTLTWFEIVRLRMREMGDDVSPIRSYFAEKKKEYGSPPALMLIEGYVEYQYFDEKKKGVALAKEAIEVSPQLSEEARKNPSLDKFLTHIYLRA